MVYRACEPRVGSHQVETGARAPGAFTFSWVELRVFRGILYDDWVGPVGFRVENSDSMAGDLILHAGSRQATWLSSIN